MLINFRNQEVLIHYEDKKKKAQKNSVTSKSQVKYY